ncbi:MAG: TetR/AcrR family transcriptional regulator [Brevibacterium sp.]|uniref:TetR/AcrR family transcriptional regulator n=1 Tax=Brevibacterium sp. TaxID=1701 RepID=UPI0026473570|nr:TetR/AcrR family transcriptional regulator [Brevibacterium sp.]MDN5807014.1 TetR/AcrR family transcriptional regulator [Brevibacterium sp.]MDN5833418.1 TetR/AcrR family transcriptional regulator [Brevibacterium sp.]MDN5875915.1 TetR/AcrR family transcriptional regulator [Brevibacterium sp.]MDN5909945.1 TetR/AcrR family transcriptional regulator [Brevibacterium sp.]MDN6123248.1 TetR/AcrR family transcriptional regulator [Brevibacterium sp.]
MSGQQGQMSRRAARRQSILAAARERADKDGWAKVTTRHLAEAIGFSQPVLYGHFPGGKSEIMLAVALEGFTDLAQRCRSAASSATGTRAAAAVAASYLEFADAHPAIYEAMFRQSIDARFAEEGNESELRDAFDALADTIGDDTSTEVFWGALHGISLLERAGRMRPEDREMRIDELSSRFAT